MITTSKPEKLLPSTLKFLIGASFCLSVLGLLVGLSFLIFNLNLPPIEGIDHDTWEFTELSLRYTLRFFGIIFTIFGLAGFLGSTLMYIKNRIGWLLLVGVYSIGLAGCLYIVSRVIMMFLNSTLNPILLVSAISSPLTFLVIWGIFGLFILLRKKTLRIFFDSNSKILNG
ncbi:MAG: hypothetical protein ACXACU_17740 [Candidatus Hodarchaeales archaeon]|jgi:hypothetical protein